MSLRIVVEFEQRGEGWSEVYWNNAGSIETYAGSSSSFLDPTKPLQPFMSARLDLLVVGAAYNHIRITDITNGGERSFDPPAIGNQGRYPAPAAEIFSRLLLRCESGTTARKNLWLGGLPEAIVQAPQTYNPVPPWTDKLAAFGAILRDSTYGIYSRPLPGAAVPMTVFTPNLVNGRFASISPVPPGFPITGAVGYVVVRGVKNPRGWNGVHRAYVDPAAPTVLIIGPTQRAMVTVPAWIAGSGGTVQNLVARFPILDRIRAIRIAKRNAGRPFGQPVGRRRR